MYPLDLLKVSKQCGASLLKPHSFQLLKVSSTVCMLEFKESKVFETEEWYTLKQILIIASSFS